MVVVKCCLWELLAGFQVVGVWATEYPINKDKTLALTKYGEAGEGREALKCYQEVYVTEESVPQTIYQL